MRCNMKEVITRADLLWIGCQLVTDLLQGNWCNGFWPLWNLLCGCGINSREKWMPD